jgi:hypothetical protein
MLHIHACNHLGTRLTLGLHRFPNTRRTLGVACVDVVIGYMLQDAVCKAF